MLKATLLGICGIALLFSFQNCTRNGFDTVNEGSQAFAASSSNGKILYVAPNGNDSWSGNFPSPSGSDGPLLTLGAALKLAHLRLLNIQPATIQLRAGTYFITDPIHLDASYSGAAAQPLTISAYPGEHPVLSAGRKVTHWTKYNSKIWVADYPDAKVDLATPYHELWVDGAWAIKARYPKNDTFFSHPERSSQGAWMYSSVNPATGQPAPIAATDGKGRLAVAASDWPVLANWDFSQAEITYYAAWYFALTAPITGGASASQLSYANPYASPVGPGSRYFVSNIFSELSDPGEFFLDKVNRKIYYIPVVGSPNDSTAIVSGIGQILNLAGDPSANIHDVLIDGITFLGASSTALANFNPLVQTDALLQISYAHQVTVKNCYFKDSAGAGVGLGEGAIGNLLQRSVFSGLGLSGVSIYGETDFPANNLVQGNVFDRTGLVKMVGAAQLVGANSNTIESNQFNRSAGNGIAIDQIPPLALSIGNIVQNNEVSNSLLSMTDGGGIYVAGNSPTNAAYVMNTQILDNRVLNTVGVTSSLQGILSASSGGSGIYLDNFSSGNLVRGNVVSNCSYSGININGGSNNRIGQNLIGNNGMAQISFYAFGESTPTGNQFTQNHVVGPNPPSANQPVWDFTDGDISAFSAVDGNLYWFGASSWAFDNSVFMASGGGARPSEDFTQWTARAFDPTSGVASQNAGVIFGGSDGQTPRFILGASSGWASAVGYGPSTSLVTGIRNFTQNSGDSSNPCILKIFGSQTSPNMVFDADAVFKCLNP